MWNNTIEPNRQPMKIRHMHIACWSLFILHLSNPRQVQQSLGCRNSQNMYITERKLFDMRRKIIKDLDTKITGSFFICC